jgi:hypothetical protein
MRSHEHDQMPEVVEGYVVAVEFEVAALEGQVSLG